MAWSVLGDYLLTADATSTTYFQKIIPRNSDMILRAVRTYVIVFNNPTFTALTMKLYSNNAGSPRALIATSTNSQAKASITTLANAIKEIHFNFADIILKKDATYHLVLNATGYTGTTSAHVAWKHSYPDPAYQTNVDMTFEGALVSPYDVLLIGSAL